MTVTLGNTMVVQGGGPTAVFNATLASLVGQLQARSPRSRIYGARSGTFGLSRGDVIDLHTLSADALASLQQTPGAALGSSRFRPEERDVDQQIALLRKLDITTIFLMGGNGSMRGAELLSSHCRQAGLDVQVLGIPKTIDNDIAHTDRCPGYASAARYIAQSTQELGLDLRSLPQPVTILETMGRSVGWLAAASFLARKHADDAPHLVYLPEVAFDGGAFLADLDRTVSRLGWAVVVVAEGIRDAAGKPVYEVADPAQQDALQRNIIGGVSQHLAGLVARSLKLRCRSEKPGLLGRASMAHVSSQDQADAAAVGRAAVDAALAGAHDQMVALSPLGDGRDPVCTLVPLHEVSGVERPLPAQWIASPREIAPAFHAYAAPLVGPLADYFPGFSPQPSPAGVC